MKLTMGKYRLLTRLAVPAAAAYLLMRSRKQPAYRNFWGERFGFSEYPAPKASPRIWVHAVSVGETNAARPLIEAMLEKWPDADILLTHMTPTGRDAGARIAAKAPERISQCYLPYDLPGAMSAFFRQTKPSMAIVMETEIWPVMMEEAERWGVPAVLVNARESEKSLRKALKVKDLMIPAVKRFAAVLAQSEADAARFSQLGAERIAVTGSLKFDIRPDAEQQEKALLWKTAVNRPVELIASTREGEEALLLEALSRRKTSCGSVRNLILLVPRHPQRFDSVAKLIENCGFSVQRKSRIRGPEELSPETEILLGDTMGEMSFYCALADTALMGGSFLEYGCQNLIEPCAAGVPVVLGPSVFNFAEAAANALSAGAALQVKTADEALRQSAAWISDPEELKKRRQAALQFAAGYVGATDRTMAVLEKVWKKEPL